MKPIAHLTESARAAGMPKGGYIPTGMISWRIDQLHVSTPVLTIAREFWHRRAKAFPRPLKSAQSDHAHGGTDHELST
jgi:hypothetical protein